MTKVGQQSFETLRAANAFAAKKKKAGYTVSVIDYFDSYMVSYQRELIPSQHHRRETRIYRKGGYSYPEDERKPFGGMFRD